MASSQRDKNPSIGRKEYLEILHSSYLILVGGTATLLIWPWAKVHIWSLWAGRKDQAQICLWSWSFFQVHQNIRSDLWTFKISFDLLYNSELLSSKFNESRFRTYSGALRIGAKKSWLFSQISMSIPHITTTLKIDTGL